MQNEYRFKIRMKWSYKKRRVFYVSGIFAPNVEAAEEKLKNYVENLLVSEDRIMDTYEYDILAVTEIRCVI